MSQSSTALSKFDRQGSGLTPIELERIASLKEGAKLAGVSVDTLRRNYAHLILQMSPRRLGIRVKHALRLTSAP